MKSDLVQKKSSGVNHSGGLVKGQQEKHGRTLGFGRARSGKEWLGDSVPMRGDVRAGGFPRHPEPRLHFLAFHAASMLLRFSMYPAAGAGAGAMKEISPESNNRRVTRTAVKPKTKKPINSVIDPSFLTADKSSTVGKRPSSGRDENHNADNISSTRF
jgi:hypothetical protein